MLTSRVEKEKGNKGSCADKKRYKNNHNNKINNKVSH